MTRTSRSQKAARYGSLAERAAFDRYSLEPERDDWHDARGPDGRPWDVKAAMLSRTAPRFRLWRDQHGRLLDHDGGYVFVAYRPVGRGIKVVKMRSVSADSLSISFYGAGSHVKGDQVKVPPEKVF